MIEILIVICGCSAYLLLETKFKLWSYILFGIVNTYYGVQKLIQGEYALSVMFFVYLAFCVYNLYKVKRDGRRRECI